jgi:DNA end-binding protein Ku
VAVYREMVQLAKELIDRQTSRDDPSDLEDRYETRLRAMIDAKLKGEGIEPGVAVEPDRSNVVDLMAALKKSLGQPVEAKPAEAPKAAKETKSRAAAQPAANVPRKRA